MASFKSYKCKECGYEVWAEPQGFHALMTGQYYQFRCNACKRIVSISAQNLAEMKYDPRCPECYAGHEHLSTWNPIEGHCPKCNGEMECDSDVVIMAD